MVNVTNDNSDISYTNSYWINNVISSQNENEEKVNDEYEIYLQELESLTIQEDIQRHTERYDRSRYNECRPHREWSFRRNYGTNYTEFPTNYKKSYNQQKVYYQKDSFVKPNYSKSYTNDSKLDKILARDRGTKIIVKSWSRNNL